MSRTRQTDWRCPAAGLIGSRIQVALRHVQTQLAFSALGITFLLEEEANHRAMHIHVAVPCTVPAVDCNLESLVLIDIGSEIIDRDVQVYTQVPESLSRR